MPRGVCAYRAWLIDLVQLRFNCSGVRSNFGLSVVKTQRHRSHALVKFGRLEWGEDSREPSRALSLEVCGIRPSCEHVSL